MRISRILKDKGDRVVTIGPDATIAEVVDVLQRERIGAIVVTQEREGLVGIISKGTWPMGWPSTARSCSPSGSPT